MALNSFTASEANDKTGFTIRDTGSWGTGTDPAKSQILSDDLEIYLPDGLNVGTGTPVDIDLLGDFDFPDVTPAFIEYITDMAQTGTMPDGAYRMVRTTLVDTPGGEIPYTYEWTMMAHRIADCCYENFLADNAPCSCDDKQPDKVLMGAEWDIQLQAIVNGQDCADGQNIPAAINALTRATELCNQEGCATCSTSC